MSDHTVESQIRKEFGDHACETCGTYCADSEDLYNAARAELQALRQENARLTKSLAAADAYFPVLAQAKKETALLHDELTKLKAQVKDLLNHLSSSGT